MKKLILTLIFIILGLSLIASIDKLLIKKPYAAHNYSFYNEPKNSLDMLFFSSSTQHYAISPMYLWDKYGIVSYKKSIPHQSAPELIAYIEEALHYQNPKVIYIDVQSILSYHNYPNKYFIMTLSQVKNYYIRYKYLYKFCGLNCVLNDGNTLAKFHTRWKVIRREDFKAEDYLKGFQDFWHSYIVSPQKSIAFDYNNKIEITDDMENGIKYLIDLAEKNNINLVFVAAPVFSKTVVMKRVAAFEELAAKYKLNYINLNNHLAEMNFDVKTDMTDSTHPNFYGGKKIMDYVIPKIIEQYKLQDHRNDLKYIKWHSDYLKYERVINREEMRRAYKTFSMWYEGALYDNYTILISSNGDDVLNRLPQDIKDKFKLLGLNKFETDKKNQKYAAIIDDGKVFFEEISAKKAEYSGRMKNIVNLEVSSENKKSTINVSGKQRSKNKYGLNFVIYDKVNREIVDSIWIEPNKPDVVRR